MRKIALFALTLVLAGCATAKPKPEDGCGGNHRPHAVIEVRRA